jgi:hypothetical protein
VYADQLRSWFAMGLPQVEAILGAGKPEQLAVVMALVRELRDWHPKWHAEGRKTPAPNDVIRRMGLCGMMLDKLLAKSLPYKPGELGELLDISVMPMMHVWVPPGRLAAIVLKQVKAESIGPKEAERLERFRAAIAPNHREPAGKLGALLAEAKAAEGKQEAQRGGVEFGGSARDGNAEVSDAVGAASLQVGPESYLPGEPLCRRVRANLGDGLPVPLHEHVRVDESDRDLTLVREIAALLEGSRATSNQVGDLFGSKIAIAILTAATDRKLEVARGVLAVLGAAASVPNPYPPLEAPVEQRRRSGSLTAMIYSLSEMAFRLLRDVRAGGVIATPAQAEDMVAAALEIDRTNVVNWPAEELVPLWEKTFETAPVSEAVRRDLTVLRRMMARSSNPTMRVLAQRLDTMLGVVVAAALDPADRFAVAALDELGKLPSDRVEAWRALIAHALAASGSKPAGKWLKKCEELVAEVGEERFAAAVVSWFPLVGKKPDEEARTEPETRAGDRERDPTVPTDHNAQVLKGLVWMCGRFNTPAMSGLLGDLGLACFKMVPGTGARCIKGGTACIWALSEMSGMHAAAQLSRVRQLVKFGSARKWLDQALDRVAFAAGMTPEDLQEVCAPDFGLSAGGVRREILGDFVAELRITEDGTELTVAEVSGKARKSVPAALKGDATFKALQALAKDIEKMLPAQKDRLERLLATERTWVYADWRARYLDHPLVGPLARRLIWYFVKTSEKTGSSEIVQSALAFFDGKAFVGADGQVVPWLAVLSEAEAKRIRVRLWHPIGTRDDVVLAWRVFLENRGVRQPFKQAHREMYVVTGAELATNTYSNRFAAHIIRYPQMVRLAQARGWSGGTVGMFDPTDNKMPGVKLPQWDVGAEFYLSGAGEEMTPAGIFSYAQTDQVRFFRLSAPAEPLPVGEVPAIAFSEIMRDVDLFVGVCSLGNDPTWTDRGERPRDFDTYWHRYSFGELSVSAESRRDLLSRLIPRLAIKDKCELDGRFLKVRGSLREYKIHLGSGNILMEPNSQYLCIVPGPGGRDQKVHLPFEGDGMLSVILSKAFMLAEDDKVKDPSILAQIRR